MVLPQTGERFFREPLYRDFFQRLSSRDLVLQTSQFLQNAQKVALGVSKQMKTKTINQRVEQLMKTLPYLHKSPGGVTGFRERLKIALQETADDARAGRQPVPKRALPEPPYHGEAFLQALAHYAAHRKQARKSLTGASCEALYRKLQCWDEETATLALEESTANGWQGVFKPKEHNGNGHAKSSNVDYSMANVNSAYERALAEEANEERSH